MTADAVIATLTDLQRDLRRTDETAALAGFITSVANLPAGSRPTGVLLAQWLCQARDSGRDIGVAVDDALILLRLLA